MMWFKRKPECTHDWVEKARTYAPPVVHKGAEYSNNEQLRIISDAARGITTILWECSKCLKLRRHEMLGAEVKKP